MVSCPSPDYFNKGLINARKKMNKHLRKKLLIVLGSAMLLLGSICNVPGQFTGSRRVRVYNPWTYHRTRTEMSRRAAMRKVLKKKRHRAARRRRHATK